MKRATKNSPKENSRRSSFETRSMPSNPKRAIKLAADKIIKKNTQKNLRKARRDYFS
ncbi:hypothetical protein WR164_12450 [Philodulcilactobacillus myokoensis]|uniref:Uncharacterized protein n=1 Tax=Philodulcilactobacillus myokoensis TaxID=2929573 RepID=A0A9W6B2C8_9LACO|nr:hypothetical protein [Philodulcilactobacillus myokoensis]GLB47266.1 hypothetical protein WR164_12450 [Philodulcilactobacillus myokoensis]